MSKRSRHKAAAKEKFPLSWIVALVVVLLGFALAPTVGGHFVFRFAEQYDHVALIAFLVLVPAIAVIRLIMSKGKPSSSHPKQSAMFAVMNWIVLNGLIAAAIIFSPFGYIALFNVATGENITVAAKVCCVHDLKPRRKMSCNRAATIIVSGREQWVCLADHYAPNTALADQDILLNIRQSSAGFSMGELKLVP